MDAKKLVNEQLEALAVEKAKLVADIKETKNEEIAEVRRIAAEQAEAAYIEEISKNVDAQYKIAENHLLAILEQCEKEAAMAAPTEAEMYSEEEQPESI